MQEKCEYRISVKGVEFDNEGRILLAKEDNGMWELLGGGLEYGENPIECLKREIKEETGLTVTRVSQEPKYFVTAPKTFQQGWLANIVYEIKLEDYNFTPSNECQDLRFFSVDEAKDVELFPNVKSLFEQLRRL